MVDFAHLIKLTLGISVLLLVFSLGMRATVRDAASFFEDPFRRPHNLFRASFAMNVVVPAIAATAAALLDIPLPIKVALIAMSVSPVPPILPGKQLRFGGRTSYVFGLLVAVSATAVVLAPLTIQIMSRIFQRDIHVSPVDIATIVGKTVFLPLSLGLLFHRFSPGLTERVGPVISRIANILLAVCLLPVLYSALPGIWALVGNGNGLVIAGVVVAAVAAGHWIGGPDESDRTALGIVSAMRHPGIGMAIATTNFPDNKLVPAAILFYVLIAFIVTTIYGKIRSRKHAVAP
jgi:bile acid:Na+ symporter, BASS family